MKTVEEINGKIRRGLAIVVTAEEMTEIVNEQGVENAAKRVDVVTTGTFGPMCSSGAFLNTGHTKPRMNYGRAWFNDVPAYCGIAAVDVYIGATAVPENPNDCRFGGGHVLEDLVAGKPVQFRAEASGTDCYPRKSYARSITLSEMQSAMLFNPRNAYQNYNVAVNTSSKSIHTYMGLLKRELGNAAYSSAGSLSPLICDPYYRTIGTGTKIFLGGGIGHIVGAGTQHDPFVPRTNRGIPWGGAGTLAVAGDLKTMNKRFLRGIVLPNYGVSLAVGLGIPIPVLDEEMAYRTAISNEEVWAPIWDYASDYPSGDGEPIGFVTYQELRSGSIDIDGRHIPTKAMSNIKIARDIAEMLKLWIQHGSFELSMPVTPLAGAIRFADTRQIDLLHEEPVTEEISP